MQDQDLEADPTWVDHLKKYWKRVRRNMEAEVTMAAPALIAYALLLFIDWRLLIVAWLLMVSKATTITVPAPTPTTTEQPTAGTPNHSV